MHVINKDGYVQQQFPFRILLTIITMLCIVVGSISAREVFRRGLSRKFDITGEFQGEISPVCFTRLFDFKGVDVKSQYNKVLVDNSLARNTHEMAENPKQV